MILKDKFERVVSLFMFGLFFFSGFYVYIAGGDINRLFLVGGLWIVAAVWGFTMLLT